MNRKMTIGSTLAGLLAVHMLMGAGVFFRFRYDGLLMLWGVELTIFFLCGYKIYSQKRRIWKVFCGKRWEGESLEKLIELLLQHSTEAVDKEITAAVANTRAEISALQSQINPHFLYNTLDTMRGQALMDDAPIVAEMAEALSHIFRYSISNPDQLVTLQAELRNVNQYMMIQNFRFEDKFRLEIHCEESGLTGYYIPKLVLQPIIENAVYHGLETKREGGVIRIHIYAAENLLVIAIHDNGKGMSEEQLSHVNESLRHCYSVIQTHRKRHTGVGLSNIHQRIRLLFGSSYGLVVQSTPAAGTQIEVLLPIIMNPEV